MEKQTFDTYTLKFIKKIKAIKSEEELATIIDKIYSDGFEDGQDDKQK